MKALSAYFAELVARFGDGWTRFWFVPADGATMSLMRVLLGTLLFYLHATLSPDLIRFFGPQGLLSQSDMTALDGVRYSLLTYCQTPAALWAFHVLGLAILILFAAGLWTRITAVLSLVVFLSYVHRAPIITSRTEVICAFVLLYLCFSDCGARFSVDNWLARRRGAKDTGLRLSTLTTIATRLIQVHLAMVVAMMGFSMLSGEPWWTGEAVWWLAARAESRAIDFTGLSADPKLFDFWTHAIVAFELLFPVLVWNRLARPLVLAAGVLVWTSLSLLTGELTLGPVFCIAALSFVPPAAINAVFVPRVKSAAVPQTA